MLRIFVAILLGLIVGWVDFHSDEIQATLILVFLFSFVMGYIDRKKAWIYGFIIGLGVFIVDSSLPLFGLRPNVIVEPNIFASLLALVPSLIGAYSGVGIKHLFSEK
jgi:hypothetical protein